MYCGPGHYHVLQALLAGVVGFNGCDLCVNSKVPLRSFLNCGPYCSGQQPGHLWPGEVARPFGQPEGSRVIRQGYDNAVCPLWRRR